MLESPAKDKHSSLLRKFINYGRKKFYNIGPKNVAKKVGSERFETHIFEISSLISDYFLILKTWQELYVLDNLLPLASAINFSATFQSTLRQRHTDVTNILISVAHPLSSEC